MARRAREAMRFLLLGGTGQIGEEVRALPLSADIEIVPPSRTVLDIKDQNAIAQIIASEPWSAVINAAAYTEVDLAENEESLAFAINADAPARLAIETGRRGIPLIHISTDYVFDGCKGAPYVEEDETAPINTYGLSKLAGERGVRAGNPRHIILRSSWVYSPYRKNFVRTVLRLAAERDQLTIVADQRGSPTAARDIAQTCFDLAVRCASQPDQNSLRDLSFHRRRRHDLVRICRRDRRPRGRSARPKTVGSTDPHRRLSDASATARGQQARTPRQSFGPSALRCSRGGGRFHIRLIDC